MKKNDLQNRRTLVATPKMMQVAANNTPESHTHAERERYKYKLFMRCDILNNILRVAFYFPDHMRTGSRLPTFELYINQKSEQFLTYDRIHNKWLTAKLDRLPWPYYISYSDEVWVNPKENLLLKEYLGTEFMGYDGILKYQLQIRAKELKKRHKRETDPWDSDLIQTPQLPVDWNRWVSKVGIPENFIFYQYQRKGAITGYCTYCEKDVPIKKPRHNKQGECSCCRHKIIYKAIGKAGTVITDRSYMYLIQRCNSGFIIREFQGYRKYVKGQYQTPKCSSWECRRAIYDKETLLCRAYYWGNYKNSELRWISTPSCHPSCGDNYRGRVYGKTLPSLSKNELKYTGLPERIRYIKVIDPEKYLAILKIIPQLEQLSKANLPRLVDACISNHYDSKNRINFSTGSSLAKTLGIDSQGLKRLRKHNGGVEFLTWLQHEKLSDQAIPDHIIVWLCSEAIKPDDLKFISAKMSLTQIYNYVRRQMSEGKMKSHEILNTWADYLSMARGLGMNTNDEIIFRVRKLHQRHNELVTRCEEKDISIKAGEILLDFPKVNLVCKSLKKYEYADEDYTILAPTCIEEIIREGNALNHCVGKSDRYWDRINSYEAYVLFLRKTPFINEPYYTLEIEPDGTVRQKRTHYDRQLPDIEHAKKFLRKWQKVIAKRLTDQDLKLAARSVTLRNQEFAELRENQVIINVGELAGKLLIDVLMADLMENTETIHTFPQLLTA